MIELERALEVLWEEVGRRGQNRVATQLKVSSSTMTKWRKGSRPEGAVKERVIAFAEQALADRAAAGAITEPQAFDAAVAAIVATGENRARLGVVQGYAQFVLDQLLDIAKRQQIVVDSLRPYAEAEGRVLAANVPPEKIPELLDSIRRYGAQTNAPGSDRATGTG